jgi:hypothetical protein
MTELLSSSDHAPPRDSAPGARAGDPVFELVLRHRLSGRLVAERPA